MSTNMNDKEIARRKGLHKPIKDFDIREWVSSKVYRRGVDYFHDDRVVSFELGDDDSIHAEVEGSEIYEVDISWDDDGSPNVSCTCPYDWEPVCKHAVAAILYWQGDDRNAREMEPEKEPEEVFFNRDRHIAELKELEIKKRRSKKLLESIRILKKPKGELCGEYLVTSGTLKKNYTVTVRDAEDLTHTTCGCADLLVNELGTCKHIELVKEYAQKTKKRGRIRTRDSRVWISLKPRDSYGRTVSPYEDIHIHASDPKIRENLFAKNGFWMADGYLRAGHDFTFASDRFAQARGQIESCFGKGRIPEVLIAPQVSELLVDMDADHAWKTRMAEVVKSPASSAEWTELKKSLPIKLYDYQEEGILFAALNRRSFIGDDMGLGKTIQAIVAALLIKRLAGINKVLVFCPASLKFQWKREIEKISGERAEVIQGNRLARRALYKKSDAMFLIVNYEMIFRDEELLHELGPAMIILDEAQRIKNWETKTAKGIKRLKSEFALILTGTPFENKLVELHSLCEFLHPRALGPMWRLLPTYGNLDVHDKLVGFSNLSQLRLKIEPFFLRREKGKVLNQLPDKIVNEYTTEITSEQRAYHDDYEAALARLISIMKKRPLTPEEVKKAFMCLTAMRIISNALAQHDWKKFQPVVDVPEPLPLAQIRGFHSPKLLEFRSVMEDILDQHDTKFVIFSQWERMLLLAEASIRDLLMQRKMEAVIFSGAIPTTRRGAVIDRFINDPKLKVFFSTDAGGLGLNLQESASFVINLEMPWNPAVLDQRIARVHRLGQKKTVNVINFISTGCIEERVYAAVCNKRLLFDGVFDGKTDDVTFEKASSFMERLKDMVGEAGEDAAREVRPEIVEELEKADDVRIEAPLTGSTPTSRKEIDLTGIVSALGNWLGDKNLVRCPEGSFKVGIERNNGELSLKLKSPPQELVHGIKGVLKRLIEAIGE